MTASGERVTRFVTSIAHELNLFALCSRYPESRDGSGMEAATSLAERSSALDFWMEGSWMAVTGSATPISNSPSADRVLELLTRQRLLYEHLDGMSRQQTELISTGQAESLLSLLGKRQQIINQLNDIQRALEPFRAVWDQTIAGMDDASREQASQMVKETEQVLSRIIAQDEQDRSQLEKAKDAVGNQLSQAKQGGAAVNAYRAAAQGAARYTDRKG